MSHFTGHPQTYQQRVGIGHVPSYQISGIPFATASFTVPVLGSAPLKIDFPQVTKFVTVVNTVSGTNVPLRVGFSALGTTGSATPAGGSDNFFTLDNGDSYTGEWRVQSIFVLSATGSQASASIIAGLTGVPFGSVPGTIAGTLNWSGSVGVG